MLKQPNIPIKCLPDSLEDTTSLIDSRGDYPLQSFMSNSRSRFSLLSASRLNDKLGSMQDFNLHENCLLEEDESSNTIWCTKEDGLHRHPCSTQDDILTILSGAHTIGKTDDNNEDAFFFSDRAFGVADGVSGWVDFGFSSHAFSTELMKNCQEEIKRLEAEKWRKSEDKAISTNMRKNSSFLSFEMCEEETFEFKKLKGSVTQRSSC